jgi:NADPH2:quinone reductase
VKAIQVQRPGGVDVLEHVDIPTPVLSANTVLVRVEAIGVNFIDVYHRTGAYPMPLPFVPGSEGAGTVVETGERVAWALVPGAYAEYAAVPSARLLPLPDGVDSKIAAATLFQGLTAHYLTRSAVNVRAGMTVLVHAAAGGVGGLLVQMAKHAGARVLGTASTTKLDIASEHGADVVIDYTREDVVARVRDATEGRGVDVVYDSVGLTTFDASLGSLASRGTLVLFGQSSGAVPPVDLSRLASKSAFLTRPSLGAYTATREELLWRAGELFSSSSSGALRVRVDRELPLAQAAEAHRLLESRATSGKIILIP